MLSLVDMDGLVTQLRRLKFDLSIANANLQYVLHENERLSGLVKDLKTKLHVLRTVGASQTQDNVSGVTLGPSLSVSNIVKVPTSMQPIDVVEGGETEEHIFEHMDADTGACMDICEIHATHYKLKRHIPACKSRGIWICHVSDAHMILEAGKSKLL